MNGTLRFEGEVLEWRGERYPGCHILLLEVDDMGICLLAILALPGQVAERFPEPPAKNVEDARKRIRDLFKEDYSKKATADAQALARKLLKQAQENKSDAALTFALLCEAREKAVESCDPAVTMEAVDLTARSFAVSSIELKSEALDRIRKKTRAIDAIDGVLGAYLSSIEEAVKTDCYEEGEKLFPGADDLAQRIDPAWAGEVRQRKKEFDAFAREYKAVKKHLDELKQDSDNPEANFAAGKFQCFVKNAFEIGLPMLAKGSNQALKAIAVAELGDSADESLLGDAWFDLSKKFEGGKYEKRFQERAFHWYDRAWPKKSGLDRVELDKKLNEREERFGKVNLLRLIDPQQDARPLREDPKRPYAWSFKEGVLVAPTLAGMAVLEVPYTLPADYDLEIRLEFLGNRGSDLFYVFPPSTEGRCVGLQGGAELGTHRIADTSKALEIPSPQEKGKLTSRIPIFANGKVANILIVARGGNLTVIADNRTILSAPGKFSPPKKAILALGCYSASYQVHALRLSPPGKRLR